MFLTPSDLRHWNWIWGLLWLLFILAAHLLQVTDAGDGVRLGSWRLPETCSIKLATGGACRSCGLTRSVITARQLKFTDSAAFHPAGRYLFVIALVQVPGRILTGRVLGTSRFCYLAVVELGLLAAPLMGVWILC